jgi:hypothetical protein
MAWVLHRVARNPVSRPMSTRDSASVSALERRSFLKLAGTEFGLAALPSVCGVAAADKPVEPESKTVVVSEKLMPAVCAYLQKSGTAELPAAVMLKTKHHLLDTLAAIMSGAEFKVGKLSTAFVHAQGTGSEACVAGANFLTTAINASFAPTRPTTLTSAPALIQVVRSSRRPWPSPSDRTRADCSSSAP